MPPHITRRALLRSSATLSLMATAGSTLPAFHAIANPRAKVRLGAIGLSFHAVVGAVVQNILEAGGATVEVTTAPHDQMFERLGKGEVDLLAAAWMPGTHSHLFNPIADRIERVATVYTDARLYWTVPAYIPSDAVATIEDLLKPDVAARMEKTIRAIGPSAGLSIRSQRMIGEYGLGAAGYAIVTGDAAGWLQQFREANASGRWIVMPSWQPQFLNKTHDLRILKDPKGVMGTADEGVVVANKAFIASLPERLLKSLRAIDIGLDGVTAMDLAVNTRGLSARDAATEWMAANKKTVDRWMH